MQPYHPEAVLIEDFITRCLAEDIGTGDVTTLACIDPTSRSKGKLLVKDVGIIAGIELAEAIFRHVDPTVEFEFFHRDGDAVHDGDVAFFVECHTHALL
ncbi:MAG: nicotinate-nucleotide diphosphorylase (carboxylating), partial [Saprospiraceae bacterium]|nr:nicotinate-nucleotide diphosphorylase (carboxylating) [Saprospiraceae bacterium]